MDVKIAQYWISEGLIKDFLSIKTKKHGKKEAKCGKCGKLIQEKHAYVGDKKKYCFSCMEFEIDRQISSAKLFLKIARKAKQSYKRRYNTLKNREVVLNI